MQKFFKSTLISSYIKYLLSCNPIPTYPVINTDDYLIAGATYIYKHDILKCTQSGRFNGIKSTNIKSDYLYVSDDITVTDNNQIMKHLRYNTTKKEYDGYTIKTRDLTRHLMILKQIQNTKEV